MRRRRRGLRGLGSPDSTHVDAARHNVNAAWNDLERMPPTCRGGIEVASRVLGYAEKAQAHLSSIEDPSMRAANTKLFGYANLAAKAAHETVQFFAGTCEAPGRAAGERPLFSRAKADAIMNKGKGKRKRRHR